ncbi:MAG: AraC family transcriptional regulator N-terminal domain-containing protein [Devosia sp.]
MTVEALIADIRDFVRKMREPADVYATPVPGLSILWNDEPTRLKAVLYEPVICLVLQGEKETYIGDRCVRFGAGDSLIVSHAIPVVAAVTQASRRAPYVAMVLAIDLALARGLYDEVGTALFDDEEARSLDAAPTDLALIDAMARLFRISQDPVEAHALAPLVVREVHFRLLRADHGGMLRHLLWRDSAASKIAKAIALIRADFTKTIPVAEMAKAAGMSNSAFHVHFRALTAKSPLQYQKELRLMEARRLLVHHGTSVAATAFEVGYESATHFSREYSRKFGVSPRADIFNPSDESGNVPLPES